MLTRRKALQLAATASLGIAARPSLAGMWQRKVSFSLPDGAKPYADLLRTWCDGLIGHQITGLADPALHGGLLCPACGIIHGRCGDAVYPLLRMAHSSGEAKYLRSALLVHEWSERQVSRADGSWLNDVSLSSWQGITVFHAIALAEALHHHGSVLDSATRARWTDRLARAAKFLDGFITIETGNINYPITATCCFALCAEVLGEPKYTTRARDLAHACIEQFTPSNLLAGEGHPLKGVSRKGCQPVDLGYNVEESLPALAMYSLLTNDTAVLDKTIAALRAHVEFMLPDGAWDNSWGTRNYKWTWWGSRTSDGCHPAFVLLAHREPTFREVAWRNLELMAACTHDGLLYGGPDYARHGDPACIHHTFTHAKALATVLDRGIANLQSAERVALPRDGAYGVREFPEIGTRLAAVGDWRATVTDYDWEYVEHVQAGAGGGGGGHATGGALSILYHRVLGPILTASMTEYQMIEISNQQAFRDGPHMPLTPRIESAPSGSAVYTNLNDLQAVVKTTKAGEAVSFEAEGRMQTIARQNLGSGVRYRLIYKLTPDAVEITASTEGEAPAPIRLIVPVISRGDEKLTRPEPGSVRLAKAKGILAVSTDAGFEPIPTDRTFNLVPGFECIPLSVALTPGREVRVRFQAV